MHTPNLDIDSEFDKMLNRVRSGKHFSFTRFGDGELHVIKNGKFKCTQWTLDGNEKENTLFRDAMLHSLTYNRPNYFIGLPCSCREDSDQFRDYIFSNFKLNTSHLTFSALFVNAMYGRLQKELIPILKKHPIALVANDKSNIEHFKKQGFKLNMFLPVPNNAWKMHQQIATQALDKIKINNTKDHIFLISAGPVANTLIPILHSAHPENTYIDIGSSLDQQLGLPKGTRNYLQPHGWKKLARCIWHRPIYRNQITCSSIGKSKTYRAYLKLRALLTTLTENMF
jgi:hypothetical protein